MKNKKKEEHNQSKKETLERRSVRMPTLPLEGKGEHRRGEKSGIGDVTLYFGNMRRENSSGRGRAGETAYTSRSRSRPRTSTFWTPREREGKVSQTNRQSDNKGRFKSREEQSFKLLDEFGPHPTKRAKSKEKRVLKFQGHQENSRSRN